MGQPVRAWCSQSPAGPAGVSGMQEIAPCDALAPTLTNRLLFPDWASAYRGIPRTALGQISDVPASQ
jgi:hypothetical protein